MRAIERTPFPVWPPYARDFILAALASGPWKERPDLTGRQGLDDGSGTSDTFVLEAPGLCLKSAGRRLYGSFAEARDAHRRLAGFKSRLGSLLPDGTAVYVLPDGTGAFRVWTLAVWADSLRKRMTIAANQKDESALGSTLGEFAEAAVAAIALAARENLALDVHPSNFASQGGGLVYLDDDFFESRVLPSIGYALLRRVDEYGAFPAAVEGYVALLQTHLSDLDPWVLREARLGLALEETPVRTPAAASARERLVSLERRLVAKSPG